MKLFEILPDEDFRGDYDIDATHRWSIPGVKCNVCGWTGATVGGAYPTVLLPPGVPGEPYTKAWPVEPGRLEELTKPIRSLVAQELPVGAGTEFGPLEGNGRGKFGDAAWLNYSTLLLSQSAVAKLENRGVRRLRLAKPNIVLRSKKPFSYLEIEIEPRLRLDPAFLPGDAMQLCPSCGLLNMHRDKSGWDEDPVVLISSMPPGCLLSRIVGLEGNLVASEEFVEAVRSLGFSDITFREMRVT